MTRQEKGVEERCKDFREMFESLRREVGKVIVGYDAIVENVLLSLFCGGHVLLEGVPGLGRRCLCAR
jgi:MoxR-like ATPase